MASGVFVYKIEVHSIKFCLAKKKKYTRVIIADNETGFDYVWQQEKKNRYI